MTLVKSEQVNVQVSATPLSPSAKTTQADQPRGKLIRVMRGGRHINVWSHEASH